MGGALFWRIAVSTAHARLLTIDSAKLVDERKQVWPTRCEIRIL
jgi:hypothetical protein